MRTLLTRGGLIAIAALHVAAAPDEWEDARVVFWLFIALAAACLALAAWPRLSSAAVLTLAVVPMIGYVVSRTTGLPGATDDIGDWANPLGLAALAVEAGLVLLLARERGTRRPVAAHPVHASAGRR
jgi:hypothetical protein